MIFNNGSLTIICSHDEAAFIWNWDTINIELGTYARKQGLTDQVGSVSVVANGRQLLEKTGQGTIETYC